MKNSILHLHNWITNKQSKNIQFLKLVKKKKKKKKIIISLKKFDLNHANNKKNLLIRVFLLKKLSVKRN